jgi:lipoprotein-anchoring transpeptidase ErfK/SrfK
MMRRTALALLVSATLLAIAPAHAQAVYAPATDAAYATANDAASRNALDANGAALPNASALQAFPATDADVADLLKPGEFHWLADAAGPGDLVIVVSLAEQRATVYRNNQRVAVTTVSTGMPGRETPTGVYPILVKEKMHHSNLYDNAPMPFMQRLTWDGVALHAGRIPGRPASHGCVRLPKQFAEQLFAITQRGQTVIISDDASVEALLRVGVPDLLAGQIGRRSEGFDAGSAATASADGSAGFVDASSVSYQDQRAEIGGSPK